MNSVNKNENTDRNNESFWLICMIIIIAAAFRICHLGEEDLWYDEVGSIHQATTNLSALFSRFHLSPLYFFFLRYWIRLFGFSEFFLRLPSAMFGIASVFLIYKIGKRLFDEWVGVISSFILAISPFHIFYSQETRHYALFLFLTLLSILFFLKLVEDEYKSIKTYIFYGVTTTALIYTNIFGLFTVAIQNLFFFLQKPNQKKEGMLKLVEIQ